MSNIDQDLQASLELLSLSKMGAWRIDLQTGIINITGSECLSSLLNITTGYYNDTLENFLRYYCHPRDIGRLKEQLEMLSNGESIAFPDFRVLNPATQKTRWAKIFGHTRVVVDDTHTYLKGGVQDFGDLFDLEYGLAKMHRFEEKSQIVMDAVPFAINIWDKEFHNIDCNIAAVELFDLPCKQDYLDYYAELSPALQPSGRASVEATFEKVSAAFESGYQQYEWMHVKLNGELIPAQIHLVRLKQNGEYVVAGYTQDLREIKKTIAEMRLVEDELRKARDLAESSDHAKSEFLANMSHEIRTPMNAILGMTHLLTKTNVNDKQRYYLEKTTYSSKLLLRIINDILDFSKIEAGKLELESIHFSLHEVVREVCSVVMNTAISKNIALNINIDDSVPSILLGDSLRLNQIVLNLVNNAVKFTDAGSIEIRVIEQDRTQEQTSLLFSVKDSGIGMTPEQMQGLFTTFTQADTSITRKYGGTGLGLAICKSLVTLMGGEIWCESVSEVGTTFYFTVQFGWIDKTDEWFAKHLLGGNKTLLIGDQVSVLASLEAHLRTLQCSVADTLLGLDALDALEGETMQDIFFIIMDWRDTLSDVPLTMSKLSELFGDSLPPVLCTCSNENFGQVEFLLQNGISSVIKKPITLSSVYDGVLKATGIEEKLNEEISIQAMSLKGISILLAEDNEINQILATELLKMRGFSVDVANNGEEAVKMVKEKSYDLVLMDIQMPVMDGLTAAAKIRKCKELDNLPILAMTAHAMSGDRELSLKMGMNDHVTKPIDPDVFFATIDKWLEQSRVGIK